MIEEVDNPLGDVELGYNFYNGPSDRIPRPSTLPQGYNPYKEVDTRYEEIEAICKVCKEGSVDKLRDFTIAGALGNGPYGPFARGLFSGHRSLVDNAFFDNQEKTRKALLLHSPLRTAAEFGRIEVLHFLVQVGVDVNEALKGSESLPRSIATTALHLAATFGHAECVDFLIKSGADTSLVDGHGDSAMHCAARHNKTSCLKVLIDNDLLDGDGRSLSRLNYEGDRPLHVYARWDDCKGLELLLNAEMDLARRLAQEARARGEPHADSKKSACVCFRQQDEPEPADQALDNTAKRAMRKALNSRNREGHTAGHIAALHNNQLALHYLLEEKGATWKEGLLKTSDRRNSFKVFAIIFVLFIVLNTQTILYEVKQTDIGEALKDECKARHANDIIACTCGAFFYYGGNVLEPFVFIITGVFSFKLLQFLFERVLVPACDFLSFFFCSCRRGRAAALAPSTKVKAMGLECATCTRSGGGDGAAGSVAGAATHTHHRHALTTQDASDTAGGSKAWWRLCDDRDESQGSVFEYLYLGLFSSEEKKAEASQILHKWRRSKYKSILHSNPDYHGPSFGLQANYLFLYFQTLWTIVSVLAIIGNISNSKEVWMRSNTGPGISDSFLGYENFYGLVVNSACTNTVFSLFKMAVFDRRFGQLLTAYRNLPSIFLRILWPIFILFPSLLLLPPFITHIIPGFILFAWIFIPLILVYLLLLRVWVLLHSDKEPKGVIDRVLTRLGKAISFCMKNLLGIKDWSEEGASHPSLLQTYFYLFFLEVFARFLFIIIFQLTFDFSTLYFLGHGDDSMSKESYYSANVFNNSTANPQHTSGGSYAQAYKNSVFRVGKWRSQSYCYVSQGIGDHQHPRWIIKLAFF